ncbi:MAG: 30S ribosomal protein S2 [Pseudomonadota bacterium]|nr:30S ribosomal protein S2 [Pseudomonadota bacterium]
MAMPTFTMRQLLEAGVHFGHTTRRWNPRMAPYLFGERNGIHIIDLEQTVPMLHRALEQVREVAQNRGRVLFVGTKRQATDIVKEAATRCAQNFVNHRWLGGMLTNWKTISNSIRRLKQLEELLKEENVGLTKKELLGLQRERDKLDRALGGIKEMAGLPDIIVVIDTNKESIAIQEARKLSIPTIAILDSNSDPEGITTPVPGNDDAMRAIALYCNLLADAVLDGLQAGLIGSGSEKEIIPEAVESESQINKDSKLRKEDETETELVVDQETEVAEQSPGVKPDNAKSDAMGASEDKEENQSSSSEVGQG